MYSQKKVYAGIAIIVVTLCILVVPIQPAKAQFVLAGWDYPDEYGQGISLLRFYENSTGSWVEIYGPTGHYPYNDTLLEWEAGVGIKIRCSARLNSTLLGLSDDSEGMDFIRHNITVISLGETIFSQQNFSYHGRGHIGPMYSYHYDVVLNFLPVQGTIYTATITCEIWW